MNPTSSQKHNAPEDGPSFDTDMTPRPNAGFPDAAELAVHPVPRDIRESDVPPVPRDRDATMDCGGATATRLAFAPKLESQSDYKADRHQSSGWARRKSTSPKLSFDVVGTPFSSPRGPPYRKSVYVIVTRSPRVSPQMYTGVRNREGVSTSLTGASSSHHRLERASSPRVPRVAQSEASEAPAPSRPYTIPDRTEPVASDLYCRFSLYHWVWRMPKKCAPQRRRVIQQGAIGQMCTISRFPRRRWGSRATHHQAEAQRI